jgi:hypothetical protein
LQLNRIKVCNTIELIMIKEFDIDLFSTYFYSNLLSIFNLILRVFLKYRLDHKIKRHLFIGILNEIF